MTAAAEQATVVNSNHDWPPQVHATTPNYISCKQLTLMVVVVVVVVVIRK